MLEKGAKQEGVWSGTGSHFLRSDFWRNQKPMYVTKGDQASREKMKKGIRRMSLFTADLRKLRLREEQRGEEAMEVYED